MLEDVPTSYNKLFKNDLLSLYRIFPHKFVGVSPTSHLSHSQNTDSAFTIHGDPKLLDQSWLSVPPIVKSTGLAGDWKSQKEFFPCFRFGASVLPPAARKVHGDPPLDLPFEYADSRTQEFFSGGSWLKGGISGKIHLPNCFDLDSTFAGNHIHKTALSEGLGRKCLQSAHGLFDLNQEMLTLLNELEAGDFQNVDWNNMLVKFKSLTTANLKALRRIVLYSSSGVMINKLLAREIVLPRFDGKDQLRDALLYSDFGTPDLFGPLSAEMSENVKMYRTLNNKEWRMTVRRAVKRRSNSSLASPAAKRSSSSVSSPIASTVASVASKPVANPRPSKGVFTDARGKRGKRRGGRGGRSK